MVTLTTMNSVGLGIWWRKMLWPPWMTHRKQFECLKWPCNYYHRQNQIITFQATIRTPSRRIHMSFWYSSSQLLRDSDIGDNITVPSNVLERPHWMWKDNAAFLARLHNATKCDQWMACSNSHTVVSCSLIDICIASTSFETSPKAAS